MRIENYQFPESSFLSLEKDTKLIISKMMKNQKLLKLLKYPVRECLNGPDLTQKEIVEMLGKQIKYTPKKGIDDTLEQYVIIAFDDFTPNQTNIEFRDNYIYFDILCREDTWDLGDFQQRPYKIAGEIDAMLNRQHLTGIGTLEFLGGKVIPVKTEGWSGVTLAYSATHGKEDKK